MGPKDGQLKDTAKDERSTQDGNPVHMDEVLIEIGGKNTVPEFTENLRGLSAGEERSFEVAYAADAQDNRLAGKTFVYTVKVQAIKRKDMPELNDDFAKELGEFTTLDQVRKQIRENMKAEASRRRARSQRKTYGRARQAQRFRSARVAGGAADRSRLERGLRALAAQGMKMEDMKKMDLPRLRVGQREQALQDVKSSLYWIASRSWKKSRSTRKSCTGRFRAGWQQSKQTPEAVRARLTQDGGLDRIRNRIRSEKTLNFLYHQSAS